MYINTNCHQHPVDNILLALLLLPLCHTRFPAPLPQLSLGLTLTKAAGPGFGHATLWTDSLPGRKAEFFRPLVSVQFGSGTIEKWNALSSLAVFFLKMFFLSFLYSGASKAIVSVAFEVWIMAFYLPVVETHQIVSITGESWEGLFISL